MWDRGSLLCQKLEKRLLATCGLSSPQRLHKKWAGEKAARRGPLWEALGRPHIKLHLPKLKCKQKKTQPPWLCQFPGSRLSGKDSFSPLHSPNLPGHQKTSSIAKPRPFLPQGQACTCAPKALCHKFRAKDMETYHPFPGGGGSHEQNPRSRRAQGQLQKQPQVTSLQLLHTSICSGLGTLVAEPQPLIQNCLSLS